ncbi:MAG TPA: 4-hydroxy-tetrahydrodipicolinate synthase [Candidatus Limnocylindrales bacterium]|nr:4-hydroxy-tetrahydrodipicolinate synthase [Candidatus Limnocylindrales bacterium]
MSVIFKGTFTALVTPFRDGEIDEGALRALISEQAYAGVDGIVPCGSTGESATLSHDEHERVIRISIDEARGRLKVIAGTGSNNTREACRLTRAAADMGADGVLLISPYYNKPTQHGHIEHFKAIAAAAPDLPQIVYNIPGRTGMNMTPETIARLAEVKNIVGIKEASGSVDQWLQIMSLCGPDFCMLSGDDGATLPIMALGGHGVISVMSNLIPARFKAMVDAAAAADFRTARGIQYEMLPLLQVLFLEINPIPVKFALAMMGKIQNELRLPLTPLSPAPAERLLAALRADGLVAGARGAA